MTDRYAWLDPAPADGGVLLVAQAGYHLPELDRLRDALGRRGVPAALAVPVVPWKPLHRFRPTVRRLADTVAASGRVPSDPVDIGELLDRVAAVVVMNDWGVPRTLVERAQRAGVPTFAWVEGVQDYDDVDTGLERQAYRRVDHVFTLGEASRRLLGADRSMAIGSERISRLWQTPAGEPTDTVLVNSNFTYGVRTDARRGWLDGVVDVCEAEDRPWVLSRHVAERGRVSYPVSDRPVDELLAGAGHLVSRFSTVALDALASGIELAYHNPHGEQEPTFADPMGAFTVTRSVDDLRAVLQEPPRARDDVRAGAEAFLRHHVLLDSSTTPAERAAAIVADAVG
jgi:hypothetical protein